MKVAGMCLQENENRAFGVGFRRKRGSLSVDLKKLGLFGYELPKIGGHPVANLSENSPFSAEN